MGGERVEGGAGRARAGALGLGGGGETYGRVAAAAVRAGGPRLRFGQPLGLAGLVVGYARQVEAADPAEAVERLLELAAGWPAMEEVWQHLDQQARQLAHREEELWRAGAAAAVNRLKVALGCLKSEC